MEKNIDKSNINYSSFSGKCNVIKIKEQPSFGHPSLPIQVIFNILTYNYKITNLYKIRNYSKSIKQLIIQEVIENVTPFYKNFLNLYR